MTITYYQTNIASAVGFITADHEVALAISIPGSTTTLTASIAGPANENVFSFITDAGVPNVADWPAASAGDPYEAQLDVTAAGADLSYGLVSGSGETGFCRITADGNTISERVGQNQTIFSGTGLKVANNPFWNPSAGLATDRFAIAIYCANGGMMAQDLTLEFDTAGNAYVKGPWTTAPVQDTPELSGRPFGLRGSSQMRQLLGQ